MNKKCTIEKDRERKTVEDRETERDLTLGKRIMGH